MATASGSYNWYPSWLCKSTELKKRLYSRGKLVIMILTNWGWVWIQPKVITSNLSCSSKRLMSSSDIWHLSCYPSCFGMISAVMCSYPFFSIPARMPQVSISLSVFGFARALNSVSTSKGQITFLRLLLLLVFYCICYCVPYCCWGAAAGYVYG